MSTYRHTCSAPVARFIWVQDEHGTVMGAPKCTWCGGQWERVEETDAKPEEKKP